MIGEGISVLAIMAAAVVATPPPGSAQDRYNAAQAAFDKGEWQAAADGFTALLPADVGAPLNESKSVIALRLSVARVHLGDFEGAEAAARRGLAGVGEGRPADLAVGWETLGDVDRHALALEAATEAYGKALDYATRGKSDYGRSNAALGLAYSAVTRNAGRVAEVIDSLLADKALLATIDRSAIARLQEVRALAALNLGQDKLARSWIDRALIRTGGADTTRVSMQQVDTRGDAAIIAQRMNDPELARRYLAFTGAGHLDSVDWIGHHSGSLPVCHGDGDLTPDDVAIVQFGLAPDGGVAGALPIFASRQGDVGIAFARALATWRWPPKELAQVNSFWRSNIRFEMRCETRPQPERLASFFINRVNDWQEGRHAPPLSKIGGTGDDGTPNEPWLVRARRYADANGMPPDVYALLVFWSAQYVETRGMNVAERGRAMAASLAKAVPPFAATYPADVSTAWLLLEWALANEQGGDFAGARPLLERVLAFPAATLDQDPAIREVATLHLALVRRQLGDAAAADTIMSASGISPEQCALVDTRPVPLNLSIVSSQFPSEALRWRFEGYVQVAYDIRADGTTTAPRTVLAYPPFVFGPGTEEAVKRFRYAAPTIGGKAVGCSGATQVVNYRIPG